MYRESREHKGTEKSTRMSFLVKRSSGDQPSLKSGWREARIPKVEKAKGIAQIEAQV